MRKIYQLNRFDGCKFGKNLLKKRDLNLKLQNNNRKDIF